MSQAIEQLTRIFTTMEAGRNAVRPLKRGTTVGIRILGEPGEYTFERTAQSAEIRPGAAVDPDFILTMGPNAVQQIHDTEGNRIGDFGVSFLKAMMAEEEENAVRVQLKAGLFRLTRRGYLKVLLLGGPVVVAFMAKHGYVGPTAVAKAIKKLKKG